MTIIYSKDKQKGLEGVYADPSLFNGDTENCKLVYTDDEKIKSAYEAKGIEVMPFAQPARRRKATADED